MSVYVSIDVETDGPIPGRNSMLSLGAALFDDTGMLASTFSRNFNLLGGGAYADPATMRWWGTQPEAWAAHRQNTVTPQLGMRDFNDWLEPYDRPVCMAYPAGFDFMFVYWYQMAFAEYSPFSFSCIDIKTVASVVCNIPYRSVSKRTLPKEVLSKKRHTHVAVDDAIEQGEMFFKLREYAKNNE